MIVKCVCVKEQVCVNEQVCAYSGSLGVAPDIVTGTSFSTKKNQDSLDECGASFCVIK